MSAAKPMGDDRREASYGRGWLSMTPRQFRRFIKKMRQAEAPFTSLAGNKGRPTPRQIKRRPRRLERVA